MHSLQYGLIILTTILISSLTFLSGFGLGTLLLPVFILFFPVDIAITCTAIVHLANNIFKALLVGHKADWQVVWKFSMPAALFAIIGAFLLHQASASPAWHQYHWHDHTFSITPVKLLVASIMLGFAILEFLPAAKQWAFPPKWIPLGGALSGFFGGLTGHQGALRSAFLVRLNLDKDTFVGTTILSAIVIDIARLSIYGLTFFTKDFSQLLAQGQAGLIIAGVIAAFFGALLGYFLVQKVTLHLIHQLIGSLLIVYAISLGAGLI